MNIYVYVDDILLDGDDADIHANLLTNGELDYTYDDEELRNARRLNIYAAESYNGEPFPHDIMVMLRAYYNLYRYYDDKIFLVHNGETADISEQVLATQLED